ncbi:hypothetical protein QB714_004505 [Salmonella enterica]|nr:hypothetical protein [Salmonella enterica]EKS4720711.1 hypothetical protein [Salmonella enterica]EKS4725139.1 hypothetical protein [Salmonella enterica]EKS4738173.1 hypothetical protein [Salmonella enterica]EKS4775454.1 hypothetical protein [Salmonella enterica]
MFMIFPWVDGDIVLESSRQISLKAGGSFIVIRAGGVDIVGPKINLNGGGSAGMPVETLFPGIPHILRFHFTTDDGAPYANTRYVVHFADGTKKEGLTDDEGYSDSYIKDGEETITAHLMIGYY